MSKYSKYYFGEHTDVCPEHKCQVVMAEYKNVDAGYECPQCAHEHDDTTLSQEGALLSDYAQALDTIAKVLSV